MIENVDISLYTDETFTDEVAQAWFNKVNMQHSDHTFVEKACAASYYIDGIYTYNNYNLPGESLNIEPLHMTLASDSIEDSLTSSGPNGLLAVFLGTKPFKKELSATKLLAKFLKSLFPNSVVGNDELFVWFNAQLINTYIWNDQGILTIRIKSLVLPDDTYTIEKVFELYMQYLCEHLEYAN